MQPFRTAILSAAIALIAAPLWAQSFPTRGDTPVTDDAEIIDAATEARMVARLNAVAAETGARVEVVTLPSAMLYTMGEDIDVYAGLLADEFGLAATPEGEWALLLVFRDDRELRLETGPAYGDAAAARQAIVDELIVPAFAEDNYAKGIEDGVNGLLDRLVAPPPPAPAQAPAGDTGGGGGLWWLLGLVAVPVLGIVAMVRRSSAKLAATPCPACGKTGLVRERVTLQEATASAEGRGEVRTRCPSCGHTTAEPFTIAKSSPQPVAAKAAKDAGDKSQGGGTTGKW